MPTGISEDFSVNQIVDENFEPDTFGVKPFDLPGTLTPIFPNLTLQEIDYLNKKDSDFYFKIKNICNVKFDYQKRITEGFIQS